MSDISQENAGVFWELCWSSPESRKGKKEPKKNKKGLKGKNSAILPTNSGMQKKKKKKKKASKFKEAMEDIKEKKKGRKKKNKEEKTLKLDGSFALTQVNAQRRKCEQSVAVKSAASNPSSAEELKHDYLIHLLAMKKPKSKKKVAFDLSPGCIRIKRPKFISHPITESNLTEDNVKKDIERKITVEQSQSQGQLQDNGSQLTADDMNSQDLFITQKTFRSPPEPSSGETSDQDVLMIIQQDKKSHTPLTRQTPNEGSHIFTQKPQKQKEESVLREKDPQFHQPSKNVNVKERVSHKEKRSHTARGKSNKGKPSFQMQMESNKHLSEEIKTSRPSDQRLPSHVQQPGERSLCPQMNKANTSTQTENFFTNKFSSYLEFCQRNRVTANLKDFKPLDLSLPHRVRAAKDEDEQCIDLELSSPRDIKGDNDTNPSASSSCSSQVKDSRVLKEPRSLCRLSRSTKGKNKKARSPQSESEPKSSDTPTSSEDNETNWNCCKVVQTQVRAVQMRLNESFFFKPKGERQSPRPTSPLMKLTQGRETKKKKSL